MIESLKDQTLGTVAPNSFTLTVAKATTTVTTSAVAAALGSTPNVPVTVTSPATAKPGGTVDVLHGSTVIGTATLSNGMAMVAVDTSGLATGANTLTGNAGDDTLISGAGVDILSGGAELGYGRKCRG